jgi:MFS family permease
LRIPLYRWLWIAGLVSNVGTFMHITAAGWNMLLLTDSPTLISGVQAAWSVPGFLLALHAGAFADRLDRRRFILCTQWLALTIAIAMAVLEATDQLDPLLLLLGTFLSSVALTLAAPAFMALSPLLVGPSHLQQALGLDAVSRNAGQAIGPAIAGVVIAAAGPGAVFGLNALSFLGIVFVVHRADLGRQERPADDAIGSAILGGLRAVWLRSSLRRPLVRLGLASAIGVSFAALMPLASRARLDASATGFGVLAAAVGVGSVKWRSWVPPSGGASAHRRSPLRERGCWRCSPRC